MSLIHDLREIDNSTFTNANTPPLKFGEVLLGILKRKNYFIISPQTLIQYKADCERKEGIDFDEFLKRHGYKLDGNKIVKING